MLDQKSEGHYIYLRDEFPVLYEQYRELQKFFDGDSKSGYEEAVVLIRNLSGYEVQRAALELQQFDPEGPSIVTCVLRVIAEVLERADGPRSSS